MKFKKRNLIIIYLEGNADNRDVLMTFESPQEFVKWQKEVFIPNKEYYFNAFNNVRYFSGAEIAI